MLDRDDLRKQVEAAVDRPAHIPAGPETALDCLSWFRWIARNQARGSLSHEDATKLFGTIEKIYSILQNQSGAGRPQGAEEETKRPTLEELRDFAEEDPNLGAEIARREAIYRGEHLDEEGRLKNDAANKDV